MICKQVEECKFYIGLWTKIVWKWTKIEPPTKYWPNIYCKLKWKGEQSTEWWYCSSHYCGLRYIPLLTFKCNSLKLTLNLFEVISIRNFITVKSQDLSFCHSHIADNYETEDFMLMSKLRLNDAMQLKNAHLNVAAKLKTFDRLKIDSGRHPQHGIIFEFTHRHFGLNLLRESFSNSFKWHCKDKYR